MVETRQTPQTRRRRRSPGDSGRNARVLQARIPEHLDAELRDHAGRLGTSVSTIVRNVLLHTFDLVGDVVTDSTQLARDLRGRPGSRRHPRTHDPREAAPARSAVVAWQRGTLNLNGVCDECNALLHKGVSAGIGMPLAERPVLLCVGCLEKLESQAQSPSAPPERSHEPGAGFGPR